MNENCPPTPIDLGLYNRLQWLTLLNEAEKSNRISLPSIPLSKATCRGWDNVSKASHVPRALRYENWKGESRQFPATIFLNTFDRRGAIEIGIVSYILKKKIFLAQWQNRLISSMSETTFVNQVPKNYSQLRCQPPSYLLVKKRKPSLHNLWRRGQWECINEG